jgi:hypothetical protein
MDWKHGRKKHHNPAAKRCIISKQIVYVSADCVRIAKAYQSLEFWTVSSTNCCTCAIVRDFLSGRRPAASSNDFSGAQSYRVRAKLSSNWLMRTAF